VNMAKNGLRNRLVGIGAMTAAMILMVDGIVMEENIDHDAEDL